MPTRPSAPADEPAPLSLRTLGRAGLYDAGGTELLLGPGKPFALLTYLALTPGRRTSREFLMELLWADVDVERARLALRQVLFHLRRLLGEEALPGAEELTLSARVISDRDRFLEAVEAGDLERAVEAYGGPFLSAFGVPGGAAFEHWADLERNRIRGMFLHTAEILVRRLLNVSRFREAQRLARRVRDEIPDSEAGWRLLLEAATAGKDFVTAAVEVEALRQWAASEGLTLEPATKRAIARARQVAATTTEPEEVSLVAELTGREKEFAAITSAWDTARTGQRRHLHLVAPAGLGKTRLIRDAVTRLAAGGAVVVELRGIPGDREIPYAFAADLALAIAELPGAAGLSTASAAVLIALNPALSSRLAGTADPAVGQDALRRRTHALADLVFSVAEEQRFVLVIDDLHWLDKESYQMLQGVLGRVTGNRVLCLTSSRPERIPSSDLITLLPLTPLTATQVGGLVTALGSIPEHEPWARGFVAGLHGASRGSPLLILQTLQLAMEEGALALEQGEWRCLDVARLESSLQQGEALRRRIRGLPSDLIQVLLMLATAGTALHLEALAGAMECTADDLTLRLAGLERQGLARQSSTGWSLSHDEIATAVLETVAQEQRTGAERAVGGLFARTGGDDSQGLLRAVRHFEAAGDVDEVHATFLRYVRQCLAAHDRRSFQALAAAAVQERVASPKVRALVRTVPLSWRLGLWSPTRRAVAAAVLLMAVAAVSGLRARELRDPTLSRLVYVDSAGSTHVVTLRPGAWEGRDAPLVPTRGASTNVEAALEFPELPPAVSPDGMAVAWTQDSGDSTTLDVWLRTPSGVRRLTRQARDDLVNEWLPDGSGLIGMTNRWSPPDVGGYDIAIFDTATGTARQITHGPSHDRSPFVSPDGTRIAFLRETADHSMRLCLTTLDALEPPECRLPGGSPLYQLLGWSGPEELLVTVDSLDGRPLSRYDWVRDVRTPLLGPYVAWAILSRDRRWVVGELRVPGIPGPYDWVIPLERPAQARRVEARKGNLFGIRWWEGRLDNAQMIDHIEFSDDRRTLELGVGTRLQIVALTSTGMEVPIRAPVRWRSSDTTVATVDSLGDVRTRGPGSVRITASLAGWRVTTQQFTVRGRPVVKEGQEEWDDRWPERWITFGEPQPVVVEARGRIRGFWNHGDGTYPSLGISRRAFWARDGLGVDVWLSTPLTRDDWQRARTGWVAGVDTTALQQGDQRKAPQSTGTVSATCGATYPGVAGRLGEQLGVSGGTTALLALDGPTVDSLRSGAWWTLRLQIFPDGRCGIAVNGQAIWVSPESISLQDAFRLRLGDESLGTMLIHGPLEFWSGVRTDVDWSLTPNR